MTIYSQDSQYGPNLRAFVAYLLIEVRLSFQKVTEHVSSLFDVALPSSSAHEIKSHIAEKYLPTYHTPPDLKRPTGPCRRDKGGRKRRRPLRLGVYELNDRCLRACGIA